MTLAETMDLINTISDLWLGKFRMDNPARTVEAWYEFFADIPAYMVKDAVKAYSSKGTPFSPSAPEIMDLVIKEQSKAYPSPETFVHDVHTAIIHFGSHNAEGAKAFLGEDAWTAAMSVASWPSHCNKLDELKLKAAWEYHVRQTIKKEMENKHG